jgi:hypothetical protein
MTLKRPPRDGRPHWSGGLLEDDAIAGQFGKLPTTAAQTVERKALQAIQRSSPTATRAVS